MTMEHLVTCQQSNHFLQVRPVSLKASSVLSYKGPLTIIDPLTLYVVFSSLSSLLMFLRKPFEDTSACQSITYSSTQVMGWWIGISSYFNAIVCLPISSNALLPQDPQKVLLCWFFLGFLGRYDNPNNVILENYLSEFLDGFYFIFLLTHSARIITCPCQVDTFPGSDTDPVPLGGRFKIHP